jgi:hypothetical protein
MVALGCAGYVCRGRSGADTRETHATDQWLRPQKVRKWSIGVMKRIPIAKLRRGAPLGAAGLALAFAATGVTAAPALAAQGHTPARTAQTIVPGTSIGSEPDAQGCYNGGQITLSDGNVMDAKGFGNPASIDEYTYNGGTNQQWAECELGDGYDEIVSDYDGNLMCLNVEDADYVSGEDLLAYQCNTSVSGNEQWRRPENTPDGDTGYDYLVPAGDYNLCVNVAGGLGVGHLMILYACNTQDNEEFIVGGSATVQDQIGMATYAAYYASIGYQAVNECNMFSEYWNDGSPTGCENWCADFAAYIWLKGGNVSFNFTGDNPEPGYLGALAYSFYSYAMSKGTWHAIGSGYPPQPGDVAVYGLSDPTADQHVAVVIGFTPGDSGPNVVNGNDSSDGVDYVTNQSSSQSGVDLSGYASAPGL